MADLKEIDINEWHELQEEYCRKCKYKHDCDSDYWCETYEFQEEGC